MFLLLFMMYLKLMFTHLEWLCYNYVLLKILWFVMIFKIKGFRSKIKKPYFFWFELIILNFFSDLWIKCLIQMIILDRLQLQFLTFCYLMKEILKVIHRFGNILYIFFIILLRNTLFPYFEKIDLNTN